MSAEQENEDQPLDGWGTETELSQPKLKKPPLYRVIMLNDDFTPMDFVVDLLMRLFYLDGEKATQVMLSIHHQGKGVCGIYTRDIAETKATIANRYAREHEYPLICEVEAIEDDE